MAVGATTLTAGVVIALMMFMTSGMKKPKKKGCPPFEYNEAQVELSISSAITAGKRGPLTIAILVAKSTWPTMPGTRSQIAWPPGPNAPAEVQCVWDMLLAQIERYLKAKGHPPWPDCPPDLPFFNLAAQQCEEPPEEPEEKDDPDEPGPFDPTPFETKPDADYPTPGTLVQIRYGDILLGTKVPKNPGTGEGRSIVYTTLASAGWMAAKEFGGASDAEAGTFARKVANDAHGARLDYIDLIQCSPWNDALYTTYGFGPDSWASPAGRALRFLPQDYDNRMRLMQGLAPRRNMVLGTPADKDSGTAYGANQNERHFAYIWLPKINLQTLWATGGEVVTTEGVTWADGSNGIMPPPEVTEYGVENIPESVSWGCLGFQTQAVG